MSWVPTGHPSVKRPSRRFTDLIITVTTAALLSWSVSGHLPETKQQKSGQQSNWKLRQKDEIVIRWIQMIQQFSFSTQLWDSRLLDEWSCRDECRRSWEFLTIVQENPYVGHYISNGKLLKISPKLLILLNFWQLTLRQVSACNYAQSLMLAPLKIASFQPVNPDTVCHLWLVTNVTHDNHDRCDNL